MKTAAPAQTLTVNGQREWIIRLLEVVTVHNEADDNIHLDVNGNRSARPYFDGRLRRRPLPKRRRSTGTDSPVFTRLIFHFISFYSAVKT